MGYTHYFPATRAITDTEWTTLCDLTKRLLEHLPEHSLSAGGYHANDLLRLAWEANINLPPQVGPNSIRFNGSGLADHYRHPQRPPVCRDPEMVPHPFSDDYEQFHHINEMPVLTEKGADLGHETFHLDRNKPAEYLEEVRGDRPFGFNFTKTARKPYDLAVCGILIIANWVAPSWLDLGSDGDPEDWQPALEWVHAVIDPMIPMPGFFAEYTR